MVKLLHSNLRALREVGPNLPTFTTVPTTEGGFSKDSIVLEDTHQVVMIDVGTGCQMTDFYEW